jgi:hypothetical protein
MVQALFRHLADAVTSHHHSPEKGGQVSQARTFFKTGTSIHQRDGHNLLPRRATLDSSALSCHSKLNFVSPVSPVARENTKGRDIVHWLQNERWLTSKNPRQRLSCLTEELIFIYPQEWELCYCYVYCFPSFVLYQITVPHHYPPANYYCH